MQVALAPLVAARRQAALSALCIIGLRPLMSAIVTAWLSCCRCANRLLCLTVRLSMLMTAQQGLVVLYPLRLGPVAGGSVSHTAVA